MEGMDHLMFTGDSLIVNLTSPDALVHLRPHEAVDQALLAYLPLEGTKRQL
jgi:hypothetical protein